MTALVATDKGLLFYRIPQQLVKGQKYRPLSSMAKLLLYRASLSVKNGWQDGVYRLNRAQKAGSGQAGSHLLPAILRQIRSSRQLCQLCRRSRQVWNLLNTTALVMGIPLRPYSAVVSSSGFSTNISILFCLNLAKKHNIY